MQTGKGGEQAAVLLPQASALARRSVRGLAEHELSQGHDLLLTQLQVRQRGRHAAEGDLVVDGALRRA